MKKCYVLFLSVLLAVSFAGCGDKSDSSKTSSATEETTVSTTEATTVQTTKATTTTKKTTTTKTTTTTTQKICIHEWSQANCLTPSTCNLCGKTNGSVSEHVFSEATCAAPATCQYCGETKGSSLFHDWEYATCTTPKTCIKCGETDGNALGHTWEDATYEAPKTCRKCNATEGLPLDVSAQYGLSVATPLPKEFSYYNYKNEIQNTVQITEVSYKFVPSNYSDDAKLYIYFSGTKTYDINGPGQSSTAKVSLKIYDSDGYVVDTKTFYSPGVCEGESFRNEESVFYSISPGQYTLELLNTN